MDRAETRVAIVGLSALVILALFLKRGGKTIVQEGSTGPINVKEGDRYEYVVPALVMPNFDWGFSGGNEPLDLGNIDKNKYRDNWDWMQTTNLGCACDTGYRKQVFIQPPPPQPQRPTIMYAYVSPPATEYKSPLNNPVLAAATQPRSFAWYLDGSWRVQLDTGERVLKGFIDNGDGTITYKGITYRQQKPREFTVYH